MPSERFKNSRGRLQRARLHKDAFESEWASLLKGEGKLSAGRDDEHPRWWTVRVDLSAACIARISSNQLSFILGEFAYQLRAALDGLIWETVSLSQGAEPSPNAKGLSRLEFPLSVEWKARDVEKDRFHGFPFPQNLIDWMRSIQPGTVDKPEGHPDRGLQNTLEDIHNLARFDRHRRLRVVGMVPLNQTITVLETHPPGGGIVAHEWLDCNPLDGKYDIVRLQIACPGGLSPYKIRLKPNCTFTIFAEDIEPYDGENIGVQLARFLAAVEHVIDRFDLEFA